MKNVFTEDNSTGAATAGKKLETAFKNFDKSDLTAAQKKTYEDVEADAREDAEHIAPYNAQVSALQEALSGFSVGTVDKFQGQEAPIAIYSMTSSSSEDAPRGMSFLYNTNRMNVATSRAKCTSILVSTYRIFEVECNTIEQMKWANGVCLYREMARIVDASEL